MAIQIYKAAKEKCRVLTSEFRVAHPHVFKAQQVMGQGEPKYSVTMLFAKNADLSSIKEALRNAKAAKYGPDKANWPKDLRNPVIDGDMPKYADKEGYKGHWVVKATAFQDRKPGLVDSDVEPIVDPADFYPGCYARAQLYASVWENEFGRGIRFSLDHIQKTRDGKSFASRKAASEVFNPIANTGDADAEDEVESDDFT